MSEPIRIAELRELAEALATDEWPIEAPEDGLAILALLDVAEAAHAVVKAADAIEIHPEGTSGFEEFAEALTKARDALARLDFTETI